MENITNTKETRQILRNDFFSKEHWLATMHSVFRMFPLMACLIAPLSVLLDIPALSQPWYGYESQRLTDEKTSLILSSLSLFFNLVANILLFLRFTMANRKAYTVVTRVSMIFWLLKAATAMVNLIVFGVYHNNEPGYTYLEGFWSAIVSCFLASLSALMLLVHYFYEFDPRIALKNNDVRLRGRGFMVNVTFFMISIGIQGLIFSRIEHWTYLDGLYFSTVSVLTVGFGDFSPTTTAGKIVLFPLVLLGIAQLAVVVSEIIDFFSQKSLDLTLATKHHIERERLRKELSQETIDLNEELKLLEKSQKEQDNRTELIGLGYSLLSFFCLWFIGALVFSKIEGWTYGNGLYFSYVFFLTLGFGDYSPATAAGRVIFIVYALLAVPVMTSFAVQSITRTMSLLSERNFLRRKTSAAPKQAPITHHALLDEAEADLAQLTHRQKLETHLINAVLKMDLSTRKLLSTCLDGTPKLLLKADTLVQLRNTEYDYEEFVQQFHDVQVSTEIDTYRRQFAAFLATASAMQNLEGEEQRLFERRVREESRASGTGSPPSSVRRKSARRHSSLDDRKSSSYLSNKTDSSASRHASSSPQSRGSGRRGTGRSGSDDELQFHMGQHSRSHRARDRHQERDRDLERQQRRDDDGDEDDDDDGSEEQERPVHAFGRRGKGPHGHLTEALGLDDVAHDRSQEEEDGAGDG
ncbi:putative Ion channel [Taphrina deformans PYCC 5710]|uniref:Ion channel n=1 Tax=Taphrina deformans (strain PYCC 5710 / ATCC 11124 / CBS 356.35 / IMI 108563 / JCM 9778 / NBRC 8474) TaxID=1097556 RepID=R4X9D5_TAPDE|nr:putative Ion channel [Taphrina deformans PYCC 5710]|eukprot:CCG82310.1 putative Ion channel [Taphrina deformans PYCC 5710]